MRRERGRERAREEEREREGGRGVREGVREGVVWWAQINVLHSVAGRHFSPLVRRDWLKKEPKVQVPAPETTTSTQPRPFTLCAWRQFECVW